MKNISSFPEQLRAIFKPTRRGVAGLVDDLLFLCQEQGIQLEWQANRCRVRALGNGHEEVIEVPLSKSVVRAILARIATLCDERTPNSVSPYGGEGQVSASTHPATAYHVAFTNTPGEQKLEVTPLAHHKIVRAFDADVVSK
ncbi:MAG: hypothetical protein ACP5XB_18965 [Isosphaeraceae bacterium]